MSQTAPAHDNAPPHPPPGVNIPEGALPNREQLMAIFQIPGVMEKVRFIPIFALSFSHTPSWSFLVGVSQCST